MTEKSDPAGSVATVRRQGRSQKTRQKILDAAMAEFAASGFEGATTRSIAQRANIPHGLVIYHYETKLGIWQAVMEQAFVHLHERFETAVAEVGLDDPEVALRALHRTFIEVSAQRPELNWLFSHEVSGSTERLEWLLDRIRAEDMDLALDLVRRLQALGRYVEGDPAHLHFLFIGAASRVFALAPEVEHRVGVSPFDPEFVEQHVKLCADLFFVDPETSGFACEVGAE